MSLKPKKLVDKPVFLNLINLDFYGIYFPEIYFLGSDLSRYDTCLFGILNNKKIVLLSQTKHSLKRLFQKFLICVSCIAVYNWA